MTGKADWCWMDQQGVQRIASTHELREAITQGRLPPGSMLWRAGMTRFIAARDLPEFAWVRAAPKPAPDAGPPGVITTSPPSECERAWKRTMSGAPATIKPDAGPAPAASTATPSPPASQGAAPTPAAPSAPTPGPAPQALHGTWMSDVANQPSPQPPPSSNHNPPVGPVQVRQTAKPIDLPSDKKTLVAGSGLQPIVVPSPETSTPSAVTLSPPFPEGGTKKPSVPAPPPLPGAKKSQAPPAALLKKPGPLPPPGPKLSRPPPPLPLRAKAAAAAAAAAAVGDKDDVRPRAETIPETPAALRADSSSDAGAVGKTLPNDLAAAAAEAGPVFRPPSPPLSDRLKAVGNWIVEVFKSAHRGLVWLWSRAKPAVAAAQKWLIDNLRSREQANALVRRFLALLPDERWILPSAAFVSLVVIFLFVGVIALLVRARPPANAQACAGSAAAQITALSSSGPLVSATAALSAAPPTASAEARPSAREFCAPTGGAERLAPRAFKDVPIEVWAGPDGRELAVGYGIDANTAAGLVVEAGTLVPQSPFKEKTKGLRRVVPVFKEGKVSFEVNTAARPGRDESLTMHTSPPQTLAWQNDLLVLTGSAGASTTLWKRPAEGKIDAIHALPISSKGHAVVLHGGDAIWVGFVDDAGKPLGDLVKVPGTGAQLGSPSLAWNDRELMVAFADRPSKDAHWTIRIMRTAFGTAPSSSNSWNVPAGGPGGNAIAPGAWGLGNGGWLLVWTEGKQGARYVRMQTLSGEMKPVGEAFTLSQKNGNAGQGLAAISRGQGAVFYLAVTGRNYELWGAAIECP